MIFARNSAVNVHYRLFGELQEQSSPTLQIMTGNIITTHYGKYRGLLESSENQLILNTNEIAGDIKNAENI